MGGDLMHVTNCAVESRGSVPRRNVTRPPGRRRYAVRGGVQRLRARLLEQFLNASTRSAPEGSSARVRVCECLCVAVCVVLWGRLWAAVAHAG